MQADTMRAGGDVPAGRQQRAMSLRARLVLVPTAILFLGLAGTLLCIVAGARARVQAEVDSGTRLATLLIDNTLRASAEASDPAAAFARLWARLPQVRHVRLNAAAPAKPAAPRWFARLLAVRSRTMVFADTPPGVAPITLRTNPADEIDEIWSEAGLLGGVLGAVWLVLTVLIGLTVTRALRPLDALRAGFDRLERGDTRPLPRFGVAELRRIGAQFNRLAAALGQAKADNHLLVDRLMSLQEAERRELAHELHDEIGPSLFGIRADAACIQRACQPLPPEAPAPESVQAILERTAAIDALAEGVQRATYRMLERLRPLLLSELGLEAGVLALVDAWRARLPGVTVTADMDPALGPVDEDAALTLYRCVQEALTNIARHAHARRVQVVLARAADGGVRASVRDDGAGLPPGCRFGFGLLGMAERARRLGGALAVRSADGGGTLVDVTLPAPLPRPDLAPVLAA